VVQLAQVLNANHRALRQAHRTTTGPIEHPLWDLKQADILAVSHGAAKDSFVPRYRLAGQRLLAVPGVPGINDFAKLSIMRFVLSTCRIPFGTLKKDTNSRNLVKRAEVLGQGRAVPTRRSDWDPVASTPCYATARDAHSVPFGPHEKEKMRAGRE
jgi:hypothetical protein